MAKYGPQTGFSDEIHAQKYREEGETFVEAMNRIAGALKDSEEHFRAMQDILRDMRFLPGGRVQSSMGATRIVSPINCFMSGDLEDDSESIALRADQAFYTMRLGGGIGTNFSTLRPSGALITSMGTQSGGPIPFMGVFDAYGKAVSSAGHRRGAQMGVLRVDHPDIEKFIHAKNDSHTLTGFNISVLITDEFMRAVEADGLFDLTFGGKVYKTVQARNLWEMIMRSTYDYAEPGVIFIDRIQAENNLAYCETITGTNPCLVEGTLVSTAEGFRPVEEVRSGDLIQTIDGLRPVSSTETHEGVDLFRVTFSDGTILDATAAHIFHVDSGEALFDADTRLDQLKVGDKVRVEASAMPDFSLDHPFKSDRDYGLIIGSVIGDGCYTIRSRATKIACDKKEVGWHEVLLKAIPGSYLSDSSESCVTVASTQLTHILDKLPLNRGYSHEKSLPLDLLNSNREFLAGYIDGMISTDGNVNMSKNPMVRVASSNNESLQMLKRALSCFGIHARIYLEKAKAPGSRDGGRLIGRQIERKHQGYVLCIMGGGIQTLYHQVGVSHPQKSERLRSLALNGRGRGGQWTTKIKSIEPIGAGRVYDLFEPVTDTWITDGIVSRGCGEIPLPPFGACLLGSFNLVKYVDLENNQFNSQLFRADIPHMVRGLDNVIDRAAIWPLPEQEQEMKSKRRIGIGITGLANALEALGAPYGSKAFIKGTEFIMRTLRDEAYKASIDLAIEKGPFPLWNQKLLTSDFAERLPDHIRGPMWHYGVRNSHLLAIAPTGTISLTADNVSSGLEPVFAHRFDRTIQHFDGPAIETVEDFAVREWGIEGRTAGSLTPDEHLDVLAACTPFVDQSISKTINVPTDIAWEDFKGVYMRAWKEGCKGCTTFRVGGMRGALLEEKPKEQEEAAACAQDPTTGRWECE